MSQQLTELSVVKNCPAKWRSMHGDDIVRHCTHCDRNVYNLSNMTLAEAHLLVENAEGRLCVRFYRRPDGMIMTRECGMAVRARVKVSAFLAPVLAVFGFVLFPVFAQGAVADPEGRFMSRRTLIQKINAELADEEDPSVREEMLEFRDYLKTQNQDARKYLLKKRGLRAESETEVDGQPLHSED